MRLLKNILVTGGAGFIGSNFVRYLLHTPDFTGRIINVDKLTYAGNPENLIDIKNTFGGDRYYFKKADICDYDSMNQIFSQYDIDTVVHFAAESHVDRSITGPMTFIETNIIGTVNLLEIVRDLWRDRDGLLFHHVSTDEVYGSLGDTGYFFENTPYNPQSPYSASKASSDHLVKAYHNTYNIPVTISNCSNNYGPYQFPEKLIPLMIMNMIEEKNLPVYGDGKNIRDWLYVDDHNYGIWLILKNGIVGQSYNIGGDNEWQNIYLVETLCEKMALAMKKDSGYYKKLISYVTDRPGHDRRYAINCDKIKKELGWSINYDFQTGLDITLQWYLNNKEWVNNIKTGQYQSLLG